jgi:3-mercaptopyruvate sulfurtransferase SseA
MLRSFLTREGQTIFLNFSKATKMHSQALSTLVSTDWLEPRLGSTVVVDGSWHMPNSGRKAHAEYLDKRILVCGSVILTDYEIIQSDRIAKRMISGRTIF